MIIFKSNLLALLSHFASGSRKIEFMVLKIVKYGDPVLGLKAENVTRFDDELKKLIEDMFETMYAARGVGLAAPQVGVSKRLFVMDCSNNKEAPERFVFANPQIISVEGEQTGEEGCLSLPGFSGQVKRPAIVTISGQDQEGNQFTVTVKELAARCVLHEVDHLNGLLYIHYLSPLKRDIIKRKVKKQMREGRW